MLHKINQPECIRHLEWIVSFQGDLLRALCDSTVTADDITVEWVKAQRPDINDNWLERFCNWSKDLKSIIERMKRLQSYWMMINGFLSLIMRRIFAIKKHSTTHYLHHLQRYHAQENYQKRQHQLIVIILICFMHQFCIKAILLMTG